MLCVAGRGVAWQRGDGLAWPQGRGAGTLCSHAYLCHSRSALAGLCLSAAVMPAKSNKHRAGMGAYGGLPGMGAYDDESDEDED